MLSVPLGHSFGHANEVGLQMLPKHTAVSQVKFIRGLGSSGT